MTGKSLHFRRAILGGLASSFAGLVGLAVTSPLIVSAHWWLLNDSTYQWKRDVRLWTFLSFPGVVVIPLLLFVSGFVTCSGRSSYRFPATLFILSATSLPMASLLGTLGMSPARYKMIQHPPMYLSEFLMFLLPMAVISYLMMFGHWNEPKSNDDIP